MVPLEKSPVVVIKKRILKNERTIDICQDKITADLRTLIPNGSYVFFERGKGVWQGEVIAHLSGISAGEVNVRTASGGIHHVNYKTITEIQPAC